MSAGTGTQGQGETAETLVFNGVDAATGEYLVPPMSPEQVSDLARGVVADPDHLKELRWWHHRVAEASFGPREGVDPMQLDQTGWAVVFAHDADPAVKAALGPLLEHRKAEAARTAENRYREMIYRPGETKQQFLARHGAGPGAADPDNVPYYVLIVGGPEEIPFSLQYQIDVQYAVGRLHFETVEEYASYARSVVAAEADGFELPRRAAFWGTSNPDDRATQLSAVELIAPVAERLRSDASDWRIESFVGDAATKERLLSLLGGADSPALLFTASHGVGFPSGHPQQLAHQGALLCQDWPGPQKWTEPLLPEHYLSSDDVLGGTSLLGLMCFHFACYGAGTPQFDDFAHESGRRKEIAPQPFIAGLPKRLLGHPDGGALAVVGHVERAWGYSFFWPEVGRQSQVYESCLRRLINGHPIGSAFEYLNERYAELAADLSQTLEDIEFGKAPDHLELAGMWTAHNDARGFAILGDPAVRLGGGRSRPAEADTATTAPTIIPETAPPVTTTTPAPPVAETPTATPTARPVSPTVPGAELDYGLFDAARKIKEGLQSTLEGAAHSLGDALQRAVERVTVLEVATYVSVDPAGATYDPETKHFGETAKLRAFTRLDLTGDAVLLVPERSEEIDERLWAMHVGMLEQARITQHELLKTLTAAAGGLLDALKGL